MIGSHRTASVLVVGLLAVLAGSTGSVHATSSASRPHCSAKTPNSRSVHRSVLDRELAPHGATSIELCKYSGLNGRPRKSLIAKASVTSRRTVATMTRYLDALPKATSGTVACGVVDGSETVAYLTYPNERPIPIEIETSGCLNASNGYYTASQTGPSAPKLTRLMTRLLKPVH